MYPDGTATSRSFALRVDEAELSVDVKSLTDAQTSVVDPGKYALYEILNIHVLELGLGSFHDPLPNSQSNIVNPAHAVITGMLIEDEIIPAKLAKASRRVLL